MAGTASALNRFASVAGDNGEDRYAHTDLEALSGLLDGAGKTADVLRPVVVKADAKAFDNVDRDAASIARLLATDAEGNHYRTYDTLSSDEKAKIRDGVTALATQFSKLRDQLGVE